MEDPSQWNRITAALASAWDPAEPASTDTAWAALVEQKLVFGDDASRATFERSIEKVRLAFDGPPKPGPSPWYALAEALAAGGIVTEKALGAARGRGLRRRRRT